MNVHTHTLERARARTHTHTHTHTPAAYQGNGTEEKVLYPMTLSPILLLYRRSIYKQKLANREEGQLCDRVLEGIRLVASSPTKL